MKNRIAHYLGHQTLLIAQIIFLLMFTQLFLIDFGRVDGTSMEPTLVDDQFFLVDRISLLLRTPKRGEIVQFYHPLSLGTSVVKRVVGLPGETINIKSDKIVITTTTGTEMILSEPYLPPQTYTTFREGWSARFVIPADSYFVLGDHRSVSVDSREFGPVHRKYITGLINVLKIP